MPWEIADASVTGREHIVSRLDRACRNDRTRGVEGHWSYNVARHSAMLALLKVERAELSLLRKSGVSHGAA